MNWLLLVADVLDAVEQVLRQYAVSETVQVQEPAQLTLEVERPQEAIRVHNQ
jgi:hypothetical protein